MDLKNKIEQFAETLTPGERAGLKLLLANAVAETIDAGLLKNESIAAKAYKTCVASINRLQSHKDLIPYNGVVYRGYPDFFTDETLSELINESELFRNSAIKFHDHFVVSNAPFAKKIASSTELHKLLSDSVGDIVPTGKANYIYYDEIGLGIEPHIDNEDFSLNVILMLKHEYANSQSALVLYPIDKVPEKIFLKPGELVIFFADSIIHARERMSKDEKLTIVAFGFKPI
ncbi:MAG: hypothetical protein JWR12_3092 [Mucilaginibacter sp.]|nr:hypothetical protein [Mucilaginibacter sp.]